MRISELARCAGVSTHAIRHYESLGLIQARRLASGYRVFDDTVLRELRFITMSRQCGLSLARIGELLPAYRRRTLTAVRMIDMLQERIAEIDADMARQQTLRTKLVDHIAWFHERASARTHASARDTPAPATAFDRPRSRSPSSRRSPGQ